MSRFVIPDGVLRVPVERALEDGRWSGPLARLLSSAWGSVATRTIARPLVLPDMPVVCVGGATLGGSGKTPVAIAYAKRLVSEGARVVIVGHAYGSNPERARVVSPTDDLAVVGDEAIIAARAGLDVVVAPTRQAAVDFAARRRPDAILIDGPLTTRPAGPALSILALDRAKPWGSERVAPAGDLRAPRDVLLAHADVLVHVDACPSADRIAALRGERLGLITAIARPRRLIDALATVGIVPVEVITLPDHGRGVRAPILRNAWKNPIDAWLTTEKCALHLERSLLRSLVILDAPHVDVGALPTQVALTLRSLRQ